MIVAGGESGLWARFLQIDCGMRCAECDHAGCEVLRRAGGGVRVGTGRAARDAGGDVSLHSPSGPVSLIAGGHATAAMPWAIYLEHAVYEADWRAELVLPHERVEGGQAVDAGWRGTWELR